MASKQRLHAALIASPGIGHLGPVLQLAHRLTTHHNLRATVLAVITTASPALTHLLNSFPTTTHLSVIQIPAADISTVVSPDATIVTQLLVMMRETIPAIRATVSSMDSRPHILIGDIFSTGAWAVAGEFGMPKYVFMTTSAWFTGLFVYSPVLDKGVVGEYVDLKEPLEIPGCKPVRPEDVVDAMLDRADETYRVYIDQAADITLADGMLINTWEDLESQSLDALRNNEILRSVMRNKPVYTVGPVRKTCKPVVLKSENKVLEWLDKQPQRSVIYVSFGSGGTISLEQMRELAYGLEMSQQRFVWVVRPPSGQCSDGSFFKAGQSTDISDGPDGLCHYLPEGFLTRTEKVGLVVPSWAPQVEILNHTSVAGFLTHCGWNSTLESITRGVPMIAWPLYAEQKLNAAMLTMELKVALRPEVSSMKKVVGREEVEKMVRLLVEGEEGKAMGVRVNRLKEDAEKAIRKDGSSYISVCKFIEDCWSHIH